MANKYKLRQTILSLERLELILQMDLAESQTQDDRHYYESEINKLRIQKHEAARAFYSREVRHEIRH